MTVNIDDTQRKAAKLAGAMYLCALLPAVFAEFYVLGRLVVPDNASQTALNVVAHEQLFRLGIASNLAVFAIDVALIIALYVVLEPVNRLLALIATGWGLVETTILVVATLNDFAVLRMLGGARYLQVFEPDRLHALARLQISAHGAAYNVALVFAGLRSTIFCYLWLRSRFIPRVLAGGGIIASLLMGLSAYSFIVSPDLTNHIPVGLYGGPIFVFELTMGFWLLVKGIGAPSPSTRVVPPD